MLKILLDSRLSNLLPPSTTLLTTIFRLSYFLLPPSPSPLNNLKQCLHFDPDSKPCLSLYRLLKSLDRAFAQLEELEQSENWSGIVQLLNGKGAGKNKGEVIMQYEDALREHTARAKLLPPQLAHRDQVPEIPLPDAMRVSHGRQVLVRALCKAYTQLGSAREMGKWCEQLLTMQGCENDVEGLVGRAEGLVKKEQWDEALRVLEKAFEESGRSRRDVSWFRCCFLWCWWLMLVFFFDRSTNVCSVCRSSLSRASRKTTTRYLVWLEMLMLGRSRKHCTSLSRGLV
jgi:DnaJ homolog subfamily C member 3